MAVYVFKRQCAELLGILLGVTQNNFDNLIWVMLISIVLNFTIQFAIILKTSSASDDFEAFEETGDSLDRMLEPDDPEDCMQETSEEEASRGFAPFVLFNSSSRS